MAETKRVKYFWNKVKSPTGENWRDQDSIDLLEYEVDEWLQWGGIAEVNDLKHYHHIVEDRITISVMLIYTCKENWQAEY